MMDKKTSLLRIRCTSENAKEFSDAVKRWPELHDLAKDLNAQGLFPGLRNMRITIKGDSDVVAKGLGAIDFNKPAPGAKSNSTSATLTDKKDGNQ